MHSQSVIRYESLLTPPRSIPGLQTFSKRERDALTQALQAPIAAPRYKVMYLVNGKERQSPWLYKEDHAQQGLAMMKAKYGAKNAIIYVD